MLVEFTKADSLKNFRIFLNIDPTNSKPRHILEPKSQTKAKPNKTINPMLIMPIR